MIAFISLNHIGFPFLWSNGQIVIDFMWFNKIICYHKILAFLFLFLFCFYCFYMSVMKTIPQEQVKQCTAFKGLGVAGLPWVSGFSAMDIVTVASSSAPSGFSILI